MTTRTLAKLTILTSLAASVASPLRADELLAGSTSGQRLVLFSSSAPDDVMVVKLTGLMADEEILGLDQRVATGELYALGSSSRLYKIDIASRTASAVGSGPFTPELSGTSFGFDFNPTVDRIRIVSNTGQNLRAHPDTGAVLATDGTIAYAALDPAAGMTASIAGSAYINNDNDMATLTTLFNIDTALDTLVTQNPPNTGVLNTVGPLGIDVTEVAGFDISASDGTAYAALVEAGQPGKSERASLYTVDLATGAVTAVGKIGGPKPLMSLASLGQLP